MHRATPSGSRRWRSRALDRSPAQATRFECRFSGIVFPGDVLRFHIWREDGGGVFQAFFGERKALDQGRIALQDTP